MCGGAVATARFVDNGNCVVVRFQRFELLQPNVQTQKKYDTVTIPKQNNVEALLNLF